VNQVPTIRPVVPWAPHCGPVIRPVNFNYFKLLLDHSQGGRKNQGVAFMSRINLNL
jgi:hypothetical protein